MEEKERYELFGEFGIIHDTSPNAECMLLNKFQTCEILNKQDKENQQLKQQLAEKDKKIANIKNSCDYYMKRANDLVLKQNQKAIEQLEKVKNKIESKVESIYKILDDLNIKIVGESTSRELNAYEEIAKEIDNQIKQLKEMK